jgi:NADPH-dependent 2,4-dienoyl-CoA reductase/sulfur reductase-like enzyme
MPDRPILGVGITLETEAAWGIQVDGASGPRPASRATAGVPASSGPNRPRVVVVGAGFAGLTLARSLKRTIVDVILVDWRNDRLFHPLHFYAASSAGCCDWWCI